jgi:hypothetical protein
VGATQALERRADDGAARFFEEAEAAGFVVSPARLLQGAVVMFELTRRGRSAPRSTFTIS